MKTYFNQPCNPWTLLSCVAVFSFIISCSTPFDSSAQSITLDTTDMGLSLFQTGRRISAAITPSHGNIKTIHWESSDPLVAAVDASGIVTPITEGRAIITAYVDDKNISADCMVSIVNLYSGGVANGHACYWIGTERTDLDGDEVSSIGVAGGQVFSCGFYYGNQLQNVCYWVDSTKHEFHSAHGGYPVAICVSEDSVYCGINIFGMSDHGPFGYIWDIIQNTPTLKGNYYDPYRFIVNGVFVSNGIIYCCGSRPTSWNNENTRYNYMPCVFIGGVLMDLDPSSVVGSICVADSTAYSGGSYDDGQGKVPCYYSGPNRIDLPRYYPYDAEVNSIKVYNGIVYSGGYFSDGKTKVPCYWTGTTMNILSSKLEGCVNSIDIVDGIVCTGGYTSGHPCFWIGKTRTDIDNVASGKITSISLQ